jgi:hypothetical protein
MIGPNLMVKNQYCLKERLQFLPREELPMPLAIPIVDWIC